MVSIINGGSHSGRDEIFIDSIKTAAENNENVLVIIPDQFSFEYDKRLYDAMGAVLFNSIQTAGFNRLAELTEKLYGGSAKENASENVRTILMYKSVRRLKQTKDIRFYKKSLDKGHFISDLNKLIVQFRESGVTPEALQFAAEKQGGSLALKLYDLSRLYRFYMEELESAGMQDSLSAVARSVQQAKDNGYFKGMTVFVDSFSDFTFDELKMLDVCISQCRSLTVSLVIDEKCVNGYYNHPFADTIKTRQQIIDIAAAHNISAKIINADKDGFSGHELKYLSQNLFNTCKKTFDGKCERISVTSATDVYEESEFVCAKIMELVREKDYRFSDIALLTGDLSLCSSVFEGAFERYEIPYFTDRSDSISASSLVRYMNSLFKCLLSEKYSTENILKYIKSPLFDMINIKISSLENYCIKWNVNGDMWLSDFTVNGELSDKQLESINQSRRVIIEPFESFKKKISGKATAGMICRALYDLLSEIKLSQQTFSIVRRASGSDNETQLEMARGLKQLWNSVLSAIKSVYDCMKDEEITLRHFYELFKLMLSQMSVSRPPQKLDCVRICDAGHSRLDGVKAVFVVEVNDGVFPAPPSSSGLITENEKLLLRENDLYIADSARKAFQSEKLVCYNALTMPQQLLFVTYSESDLVGEARRPSSLVSELIGMFGSSICSKVQNLSPDYFCTSYRTAYYKYMEHSRDNSESIATIREALSLSEKYSAKLSHHKNLREDGNYALSPAVAEELFFPEQPAKVSPTQLDTYYKCPFNYFCRYGLGLNKIRPVDMDGMNRGLIVHSLLENILKNPVEGAEQVFNEAFLKMTDDELRDYIHNSVTEYISDYLGGAFGKSPSFVYLAERIENSAFYIVKFIQHELNHSKFRPALLEYKLERTDDDDRLIIDVNGRDKIILTGIIDRVDIFEDENGEKYVRIIDYKTGKIDLRYSMLYNGLNLQMFVYLTALLETKNPVNIDGKLNQAGIVYYRIGQTPEYCEESQRDDLSEKEQSNRLKSFKPMGRVVDDKNILEAFDCEQGFAYSPFSYVSRLKCYSESAVTNSFFTKLREFAVKKVAQFGESVCGGSVSARPLAGACSYCDFSEICGLVNHEDAINVNDEKYEEMLMKELSAGEEDKNEQ